MLSLMMKFAGGTLFQRNQMDANEFLKQANLYEEVDANILDRVYKGLLVTAVNHPLTIVRAKEIMNWSESKEYKDLLAGHYPRTVSDGIQNPLKSTTVSLDTELVRCPHCGREQTNRRFCSLCGSAIE